MSAASPHQGPRTVRALDRRTFLAGVAAAGVLAACGDDDSDTADADFTDEFPDTVQAGGGEFIIVQRIPPDILVPGTVRYPIQLSRNAEFVNDGPDELRAELADLGGNPLGQSVVAARRDVTPAAYYDFRVDIDEPDFYRLLIEGGPTDGVAFQVLAPEEVPIPQPGQVLPGFDTPTVADDGGLEAICTLDPPCDFHSVTLSDALNTDKSVAYLVGTPAFCSTGTCIPALQALIEVMPDFADTTVAVHAEVYLDSTATELAPAMVASGLRFEPALFITRPDGTISERLDGIWDDTELREALERALA
ncbi:MAG: hypothetical protein AAFP84_17510 [Actinomycetota bacterium]